MEEKTVRDLEMIMAAIKKHENANDIYAAFIKGPNPSAGFMFTSNEWWTPSELKVVNFVSNLVLDYGWDSSGYGYMMRRVQAEIMSLDNNKMK